MGQWFHMVCHTCQTQTKCLGKLAEIQLNAGDAILIGWFATEHAGHQLELRGDEWTKDESYGDDAVAGYKVEEPVGAYIDECRRELEADAKIVAAVREWQAKGAK